MSCILSNPDISGIGVRTAIYGQILLSFGPAIYVLMDGKITYNELNDIEQQASTMLITAFALLFSAIIQACTLGLSNLHATVILNLSWMNNTNLYIYLLLYVYHRVELRLKEQRPSTLHDEVRRALRDRVFWTGSLHLTLMSAFGLWFWRNPETFGNSDPCALSATIFIVGAKVPLRSEALRIWSIVIYTLLLIPLLNLISHVAFFIVPFLPQYGRPHRRFSGHRHYKPSEQRLYHNRYAFLAFGFTVLFLVNLIILIDTELTLRDNDTLIQKGETVWTFGQTLALLLLLVPARDFYDTLRKRSDERQRMMEDLVQASKDGDMASVETLLDEEPDEETKDHALILAAANGHQDIVERLFDPYSKGKNGGQMALLLGSYREHSGIVKWLISKDLGVKMKFRKPFEAAVDSGRWDVVKVIAERATGVKPRDEEFIQALEAVQADGMKTCRDFLVKDATDVNAKNRMGTNVLHRAARNGRLDIVEWLGEHGADVNAKNDQAETALHLAAYSGHFKIVKWLCVHGADVNVKRNDNETPAHLAAGKGYTEIVNLLVEYGADVSFTGGNLVHPVLRQASSQSRSGTSTRDMNEL